MHDMDGLSELSLETPPAILMRALTAESSRVERRRSELLANIMETEVLPRLLAAHQSPSSSTDPRPPDPKGLVTLLREGRIAEAFAAIEARLRSGATARSVMIEDLAPAARELGELWNCDECDIVDVTLGLGALRALLREIAPAERARAEGAPSILLLPTPGETHAFGLEMVESFFHSAGWRTLVSGGSSFRAALAREWFEAVGFSLSCDRFVDSLRRAITQARAASLNRSVKILVGGAIFGQKPALARKLGADACAADSEAAIQLSRVLLREFA